MNGMDFKDTEGSNCIGWQLVHILKFACRACTRYILNTRNRNQENGESLETPRMKQINKYVDQVLGDRKKYNVTLYIFL